jgi:hypothetical protein
MPERRGDDGFVYVDTNCCTNCGVPVVLAPEVFTWGRDTCYVKRQPQGATELRRVLRVFRSQELDCIRYAGGSRRVMTILTKVGEGDKCDQSGVPRCSTAGQGTFSGNQAPDSPASPGKKSWWARLFRR